VRQSIRGYTDGVLEASPSGEVVSIASEVAVVRDVVNGSGDLKGALLDPGVPAAPKRAVVSELLESKVAPQTLKLIVFAIDHDRAAETVANIDWLAARLDAAARGLRPAADVVLGHTAAQERLDGYASAVLEDLDGEQQLMTVEDELFRFMRIVNGSEELRDVLANRGVAPEVRRSLVSDLLSSRATAATVRLAGYATQVGRPRDYEDLLAYLVDRVASENNRRMADVRSAVAIDGAQRAKLAQALGRVVGHPVQVRVSVDPSLLAGFVATIGDTVVDGSARRQFEILKERLVIPEANVTTGEPS
jgi:F-type H+-transporting ATPase subunit delta